MMRWLIDLVNERGSAAILRERVGLLTTERDVALRKVAELTAEVARLKDEITRLKVEIGDLHPQADQLRAQLKMLREFLPDYLGETDPAVRRRLRGEG